jgi:hypothetical protein
MANKFPNSGRLNYSQRKVHPKSPDLYGDITFDRSYLRSVMEETDGDEITIRLDAWQNEGNNGAWFSLKVNTWKKTEPPLTPQKSLPDAEDDPIPF